MTKIASFDNETNYKQSGNTRYYVSGGICFVNVDINVISPIADKTTVFTGLPKPAASTYLTISAFGAAGKIPLTVLCDGALNLFNGEAGCRYLSSFSYAVAD